MRPAWSCSIIVTLCDLTAFLWGSTLYYRAGQCDGYCTDKLSCAIWADEKLVLQCPLRTLVWISCTPPPWQWGGEQQNSPSKNNVTLRTARIWAISYRCFIAWCESDCSREEKPGEIQQWEDQPWRELNWGLELLTFYSFCWLWALVWWFLYLLLFILLQEDPALPSIPFFF